MRDVNVRVRDHFISRTKLFVNLLKSKCCKIVSSKYKFSKTFPIRRIVMNLTILAYASICLSALFILILVVLHFLKPDLSPLWRMISEYEIGRYGWMMRVAFFSWGASVLTLVIAIWTSLANVEGIIGRWWLVLLSIAMIGAGVFKTNPITENKPNPTNTIHTFCGSLVILTFPIAATLVTTSLLHDALWLAAKGKMIPGLILVWLGMILFFASIIISRMIHHSAGRNGPDIYLGWPNRFLVVAYNVWLILVGTSAIILLK